MKTPKRPKRRRKSTRKRRITRAGALARAGRHLLDLMFKGATVLDGEDAWIKTYGVRHKDTWVVYKNPNYRADGFALKSSDVVVVCKRTGRVLYEGPAGGEG